MLGIKLLKIIKVEWIFESYVPKYEVLRIVTAILQILFEKQ